MRILEELNSERGVAVVLVTHDDEVAGRARRQVRVRDGLIERDTRRTEPGGVKGFEAFRVALDALRGNRVRSLLTMLGIIIGIAAVIVVVSIGSGARHQIESQVEGLGSNLILVVPGQFDTDNLSLQRPLHLHDAPVRRQGPRRRGGRPGRGHGAHLLRRAGAGRHGRAVRHRAGRGPEPAAGPHPPRRARGSTSPPSTSTPAGGWRSWAPRPRRTSSPAPTRWAAR